MKTKEKKDNNSKNNEEQTKRNIPRKLHNPWQYKYGINTPIKLIRLTDVNGRHNFSRRETSDLVC